MKPLWLAALVLHASLMTPNLWAQNVPRQHQFDPIATPLQPVPAAAADLLPHSEQLTTFDPLALQLDRRDKNWVITAGADVVKDCGRREEDARLVLRILTQLGLTQRGVIG